MRCKEKIERQICRHRVPLKREITSSVVNITSSVDYKNQKSKRKNHCSFNSAVSNQDTSCSNRFHTHSLLSFKVTINTQRNEIWNIKNLIPQIDMR